MVERTSAWVAACALAGALASLTLGPVDARAELRPRLPELGGIVKDEDWARILGKALFWDQQVGSDGVACASCHFHAGADSRIRNQLSPGFNNIPEDLDFGATVAADPADLGRTRSGEVADSNYELVPEDFPFHHLADETDRNSQIIQTTNDRVSSAGAYDRQFTRVGSLTAEERCGDASGEVFHAAGLPARQVEPRNTPTMINAVFFHRLFWDGRANNRFNGVGVFGERDIVHDPRTRILVKYGARTVLEELRLPDAALASQAVAPPLSRLEMSCDGRTFADVGRKLLGLMTRPLEGQEIHREDSLFGRHGPKGDLRDWSGRGLKSYLKYKDLIKKAFHKKYWGATGRYVVTDDGRLRRTFLGGYSHMEQNFSLFWGLSIMLYEATLISDQSRFDQANDALGGCLTQFAGPCDPSQAGFTELEADGFTLFRGGLGPTPGGACVACHGGPLLSAAAVTADQPPLPPVNRLPPRSGQPTLEDTGFFGIGTRPVTEDRGLGGTDPYGNPLSFTRQYKAGLGDGANGTPDPDAMVDDFEVDPCADFLAPFAPDCSLPPTGAAAAGLRVGVDSAVKAPSLRNVALTPPYFHYGGYASLEQVIEFYARGGSRRDIDATGDNSGTGPLGEGNPDGSIPVAGPPFGSNTSGIINPLNLALGGAKDQEYGIRALVAFMKTTTDPRVQCDAAPFDHPQLYLTHGHHEYDADRDGRADDVVVELPAVGQYGYADERPDLCIPNAGDLFADGMLNRVLD